MPFRKHGLTRLRGGASAVVHERELKSPPIVDYVYSETVAVPEHYLHLSEGDDGTADMNSHDSSGPVSRSDDHSAINAGVWEKPSRESALNLLPT